MKSKVLNGKADKKVEGDKFSFSPFALNKTIDNPGLRPNLILNETLRLGRLFE